MKNSYCALSTTFTRTISTTNLNHLSKSLALYLGHHDNLLVLGGLNCETQEKDFGNFCKLYNLSDIVRKPNSFKNPSCVD